MRVLPPMPTALPKVKRLDLAFTSVGDEGLEMLAAHSKDLAILSLGQQMFNIYTSAKYTEQGLQALRVRGTIHVAMVAA